MTIWKNNVLMKMINADLTSIITERKIRNTRNVEGIEEDVQKARTKIEFGEK